MNIAATFEKATVMRSGAATVRLAAQLRKHIRSAARPIASNSNGSSRVSSGITRGFRLGDAVRHSQFGTGRVMTHWPDGTLLVRFDSAAKSRLIWPSFLDRVSSQQS